MSDDAEPVVIPGVQAIRATSLALLVPVPAGSRPPRELWVPQSVIHDDSEVFATGDAGRLAVKAWWAKKEGLE